jgi:FkbH-like protein
MESVIGQVGLQHAVDTRTYLRSRSPYTSELTEELSKVIISTLGIEDRVIKAIALDCDNTLWGGVLGEDGFDGIQIDPNTAEGAKFQTAQRRFKELKELGILICLISKNNEEEVLKVLRDHEHQLIRTVDVISHRINWHRKSANLYSLANELNIGLSSFVFVDDSEFECAEVAAEAPEVSVFQMPKDANEQTQFFARLKRLCLGGKSEICVNKTEQYRIRQEIDSIRDNSGSQKEFFEGLNIRLKFSVNDEIDVPRLAEMFSKTNQFNCTTIRRTPEEIKELVTRSDSEVVSVRVSDRFSDHGLTGLVVINKGQFSIQITDWMISCRVLGRGVEEGILAFLGYLACDLNQDAVAIAYKQTAKNIQVKNLLETVALGYSEDDSAFVFDSKQLITLKPSWVTIEQ